MKRSILCFDAFPSGGGGQKRLAKHMQQLLSDGYKLAVACPPGSPFLSGLAPAGVRPISVPMSACITDWSTRPRGIVALVAYAALTARLLPILARERPDLIYALGSRSAKGVLLAAQLARVPLAWTSGNLHPVTVLDRWLLKTSCGVICMSSDIRDQYVGLSENASKLHVISGSVDVATLNDADGSIFRAELGLSPDDVLIGVVGRVSPYKGQAEFLKAALAIIAQHPNVHAVIVGTAAPHDEIYYQGLKQLMQRSPVGSRVRFTDWRNDIPEILKALDVLVVPSYEEGVGNITLEGMAAGKPIIATNVGGVLDGVTGLLVPTRDVEALQRAMDRLVTDIPLRAALGRAGQARAWQEFDDHTVLPQVSRFFGSLLVADLRGRTIENAANMQPHILCIDCFPIWGGGEAVLVKQVGQLLADGYRITVACPTSSPLLAGRLPPGATAIGLPMSPAITDFAQPASSLAGLIGQARLAMQLVAIMRRQQVSLVYALGSRSAKAALPAVILRRVPLCWSAHNPYRLGVLDRLLFKRSAAIICVSDGIRQQYTRLARDKTELCLLHNGIDVNSPVRAREDGFRRELGLADHDILVGMIGRISPEKGQLLFIESMLPLMHEFTALHGVIIGAADDRDRQYETQVQETIARSGVAPRLHMAGWRKEIQALLPEVDIVAQTFSREAFSMVILEAMAAARPIAAFAAGGVAEAIVDGVTGLVIPRGDVAAMTQAIRRLILNPTERAAMGQAAQQRARELFDDRKVLPQFSDIIGKILEKHAGASTK